MSRTVTHSDTFTVAPTSYDSANSTVTASNTQNGCHPHTNTGSSTYANFSLGSNNTTGYAFYNFTIGDLPSNSVINSVSCQARVTHYYRNNSAGNAYLQLFNNTTGKGSQTTVTATTTNPTVYTLASATTGTWTVSELSNIKLRITVNRTKNGYYVRFYGATLTINYSWDETFYSVSTSSNVQGVSISSTSGETLSGGSNTITLSNVSDISAIKVLDNGNDITSLFTKSGTNYTYTLTNINADHTIVVNDNSQPTSKKSYIKKK